ncbi:hypothetical protein PAXRUDRAFT_159883 [Paxillus rubicundulus Ve08.2h10]|uniref:Ribonuclease H1 N-terminal domain-containing protein n=1 Tax=Paxillus rubicundulus Ve08.2h10 TaxID=930991 RepID=A0A0D0DFU3_9AGAM|nr:hypothetical protein PAXRUDRAFT_159883 [Paxillus rubicundulus Ve08.2h10]
MFHVPDVGQSGSIVSNIVFFGLPPTSITYNEVPFEIPHPNSSGPFYCIIKGRCVGVVATWEDASPQVTGCSGAVHSCCPSVEVGVVRIKAVIDCGQCQYLP